MQAIDQSSTDTGDFLTMLRRNLEATGCFVIHDHMVHRLEEACPLPVIRQMWVALKEERIMPLLTCEAFTIEEIKDDAVLVSIHETSYMSFGYAASRQRRNRRIHLTESNDDLKELVRGDRALLMHFVKLSDIYKQDQQLSSGEAKTAMEVLMHAMYTRQFPGAAAFGQVEYTPNALAWISLFDEIGDQTLGMYLGIKSPEEIPGGDINSRVDQIRQQAGVDQPPEPMDPAKMLASAPERRATFVERRERFHHASNHMSRLYRPKVKS